MRKEILCPVFCSAKLYSVLLVYLYKRLIMIKSQSYLIISKHIKRNGLLQIFKKPIDIDNFISN